MTLASLLFPPRCALCRSALERAAEDGLCPDCRRYLTDELAQELHRVLPYATVICAAHYSGVLRSAILRVKNQNVIAAAQPMGRLLCAACDRQLTGKAPDLVTFVPSSIRRIHTRGFTLSEEMAKEVAAHYGLPCVPTLTHAVFTAKQVMLPGDRRRENADRSFALRRGCAVCGKRILLVDDVLASGATMTACARLLRQAGAEEIVGLALVKSGRDR